MPKNKISKLLDKIRKEDLFPLGKPVSETSFTKLKNTLHTEDFPDLDGGMFELFRLVDGIAYNGIELFSVNPKAFKEGDYTLPDLITSNRTFRDYYSDCKSYSNYFLYLGRSDEELLIFDAQRGMYMICAREDFMVYEESPRFGDFLGMVFKDRI
ncbi:MAG: hypothetical protein AB9882_03515 [Ignavibacteriaceae bacterium]